MGYTNFENLPSQETPFSSTVLKQMQVGLMEMVFPIGSTYITQNDTNPSTILEFGTWERVKGKVLVGLDENDEAFNTIGKTGGEKTHTLTVDEMPEHNHNLKFKNNATGLGDGYLATASGYEYVSDRSAIENAITFLAFP